MAGTTKPASPGVDQTAQCRTDGCPSRGLGVLVDDDGYNCPECDGPLVVDEEHDSTCCRTDPMADKAAGVLLPAVFEGWTAHHRRLRLWADLPLAVRGDLRVMWVAARAGQTDPWLAALSGWRHRATWCRRTYRSATLVPDYEDLDAWDGERAGIRDHDREIAGQYLSLAAHLIAARAGIGVLSTLTSATEGA